MRAATFVDWHRMVSGAEGFFRFPRSIQAEKTKGAERVHQYFHTVFGFCLWDALALGVLAVIVAMLAVHAAARRRRRNKLEQELENRRKERFAQEDRQEPESR